MTKTDINYLLQLVTIFIVTMLFEGGVLSTMFSAMLLAIIGLWLGFSKYVK